MMDHQPGLSGTARFTAVPRNAVRDEFNRRATEALRRINAVRLPRVDRGGERLVLARPPIAVCEPIEEHPTAGEQANAHVLAFLWVRRLANTHPVKRVILASARHFGVEPEAITGSSRLAAVVRPRQVAMWLAHDLGCLSLPALGKRFGGRDHTTVLHAVRKIERLRHEQAGVAAAIEAIRAELIEVAALEAARRPRLASTVAAPDGAADPEVLRRPA